ncbi:MAG: hypothetical protein E7668_02260 [Ruminococcaceae bacterium]|nr:hypothetical protein [Oscillospiraceae bacterium]
MEIPKILGVPVSEYRVIYRGDGNYVEQMLAHEVSKLIIEATGFAPCIATDDTAPTAAEILLGRTNRAEWEPMAPTAYAVKSAGTVIRLCYGSTLAATEAIARLGEVLFEESIDLSGEIEDTMNMAKAEGTTLRVMSSNVLFTSDIKTTGLAHEKRADLLADMYRTWKPDILGLQEARGGIGDRIYEQIADEYTMTSQSVRRHTPILYRTAEWRPVLDEEGNPIQKMEMFHNTHCWDYEWIMLEQIATGRRVIAGNLHFQPRGYCGDMRTVAIRMFNTEMKRIEALYPDVPIFVTGDYNTPRKMKRMVENDWKDGWDDIVDGTHLLCAGQLCTATSSTGNVRNADPNGVLIDHVCMSYHLVERVHYLRRVIYNLMLKSSDHRPCFADITLK